MHHGETPVNQSTETKRMSLANLNLSPDDCNKKIEGRIKKIEEQNNWIQERFSDITSQKITNEYANDEYMDEQMNDMKKEIVEFVNRHVTSLSTKEGQKRTYPPDSHFDFSNSDDDVSVETDIKKKIS